ncbi:aspartic peptidase domain-containing protein [Lentinula raphanica]|nr:aspartic peptidase domain-containing protein [Lentinula raphanica]KAJ3977181.1 aspartic peptidase domain-containing protein [Lentinula raphanica]
MSSPFLIPVMLEHYSASLVFIILEIAVAFALSTITANASDLLQAGKVVDDKGTGIHIPIYHARNTRYSSRQTRTLQNEGDSGGDGDAEGGQSELSDFMDVTYSIMINIGGTELSVDVDTGSSDLWVISDACISSDCNRTKDEAQSESDLDRNLRFYPQSTSSPSVDPQASNSHPVSLYYGDSLTGTHAFGFIGNDTVEISRWKAGSNHYRTQDGQLNLPILESQVFAAINDTNTGVLETGCVGLLGLGFPVNSILLLETFEKDHPQLDSQSNVNHTDAHRISTFHSHPEANYISRAPSKNRRESMRYMKQRAFPDLSKYANRPSNAEDSSLPSEVNTCLRQGENLTDKDRDTQRNHQRRDENEYLLLSSSPREVESASTSPSLWTPLLLSAFNISGPPIWRIVTNAISSDNTERSPSTKLKPMFSVSLQRETNTGDDDQFTQDHNYGPRIDYDKGNPGILTIGGFPPGVSEGDLTWTEVRRYGVEDGGLKGGPEAEDEHYPIAWEIPIDDVYLDGQKLPRSSMVDPDIGMTGLIDTGSSLIRGPPDVIRYMKNSIYRESIENHGKEKPEDQSTSTSCAMPHILSFQIGGQLFPVDPKDLVWTDEDSQRGEQCYLNVAPTDAPVRGTGGYLYSWSLGDPFLKSVLASFYYGHTTHPSWDPPRIGLMSTVSQININSTEPHLETPVATLVGGKEREGVIPGVIQRPKLPLQSMLNTVSDN